MAVDAGELAAPAATPADRPDGSGLLQRVILARAGDPAAVRPLYVDDGARRLRVRSRTSAVVPASSEVSFGAYFNAFPAAYWRRWSVLTDVRLRLDLEGSGRVDVYRSRADGSAVFERGESFTGPGHHRVDWSLDLLPFTDGGWYWFDLTTDDGELTLHSGGWFADREGAGRAAVTIGMPTIDRPDDCVATLAAIGEDPAVLADVTAVVIPDQGTRKVRDHPGFAAAAAPLGDRLRIIDQPNLGGSGGYARVMYEALEHTGCEQILFMDDDILLEPDSVLRAVAFSRYAREPMLVGGQMLSLQQRAQLSTMGEVVDRGPFLWRNAPGTTPHHDLAAGALRDTPWLHQRVDVDYNAWWMCLIPRVVAQDVGLPLPLFIKWDDAEYGLRARAHGYPTATVPGIAIWHMSFLEKDDFTDWKAYFHYRNRLVAAALHGPDDPRAMLRDMLMRVVRHLLVLEYSAVALQAMALRDFLAGPEQLAPNLATVLGDVRAARAGYDDARPLDLASDAPRDDPAARTFPEPPRGPAAAIGLARGILRNLRAADPAHHAVPQRSVPARAAQWHVLSRLDSAVVSSPDGRSVTFRRRDARLYRTMLVRAMREHHRVVTEWPELRRRYRAALPELTSRETWRRTFGA